MAWAYYNEVDPKAAIWLDQLIAAGHVAPGEVDTRSIEDVTPDDLRGFSQHHFFAGIGVWSAALRLAGWPDDRPVWTGSCPCQPFSAAGKGGGFDDERHLWPAWFWLVGQCRPDILLGEQVASKPGLGWFDLVSSDLEGAGYACGAADTCAAGVGAPHIRQRLYWIGLADYHHPRLEVVGEQPARTERPAAERSGEACTLQHPEGDRREQRRPEPGWRGAAGGWREADWIPCRDGKWRPIEPGTFPLAYGAPGRVGRLRGYGNGLVLPQAAAFVEAVMSCCPG